MDFQGSLPGRRIVAWRDNEAVKASSPSSTESFSTCYWRFRSILSFNDVVWTSCDESNMIVGSLSDVLNGKPELPSDLLISKSIRLAVPRWCSPSLRWLFSWRLWNDWRQQWLGGLGVAAYGKTSNAHTQAKAPARQNSQGNLQTKWNQVKHTAPLSASQMFYFGSSEKLWRVSCVKSRNCVGILHVVNRFNGCGSWCWARLTTWNDTKESPGRRFLSMNFHFAIWQTHPC